MEQRQNLQQWVAGQIDSNLFEGCESYADVQSIIADCDEWNYEFTREEAIAEAVNQLGIGE